ncbi:hypothetical protein [Bradyrhizobium sp. RDI18]|uniref:hypothetical protein n=1 Tax=Bradyrhizobium sp. RDI18 TaxID=3367400 RepID=UPI003714593B
MLPFRTMEGLKAEEEFSSACQTILFGALVSARCRMGSSLRAAQIPPGLKYLTILFGYGPTSIHDPGLLNVPKFLLITEVNQKPGAECIR